MKLKDVLPKWLLRERAYGDLDVGSEITETIVFANLTDMQQISIYGQPDMPYTLTANGHETSELLVSATAADIQAALEALPDFEPGDITVVQGSGSSPKIFNVYFGGAFAHAEGPTVTGTGPSRPGVWEYDLNGATGGTFTISPQVGYSIDGIAWDITPAALQTAMRAHHGGTQWADVTVDGVAGDWLEITDPDNHGFTIWDQGQPDGDDHGIVGGTGLTLTSLQIGGQAQVYVSDTAPDEGDYEIGYHWRGTARAYKQAGRVYLTGDLIIADSSDESVAILQFPEGWGPPEGYVGSGTPVVLNAGLGIASLYDSNDGLFGLWQVYRADAATAVTNPEDYRVTLDGVSWPLAS